MRIPGLKILKEFFHRQVLINCLVAALPLAALILWRVVYTEDLSFFSQDAAIVYVVFVAIIFTLLLFIFFLLFLLSRGQQRTD